MIGFIPNQYSTEIGMVVKKCFVAFSDQYIQTGLWKLLVQFFKHSRSQDYVTNKGSLYDKDFLHPDKTKPVDRSDKPEIF